MQFPFFLSANASTSAALFPAAPSPAASIISLLIILLSILLVTLLFVPFHFFLNFSKYGPLIRGSYRIAWLGITLKKKEILPQSAADLLASILKKESTIDEGEGNDQKEEKVKLTAENGEEGKVKPDKGAEIEDSKGERDHDTKRSPSPGTLLNAAPAIMNFLMDLLKTIVFERLSCRLCIGLNDPADTAVMSGYLWSVASTLGLFRANVFIEPCFEGERLEGLFEAKLKTRLIWIAKAVINTLREKEIRSLIREVAGWN
jgi:Protein of unknown function (DUF2953)